MIIFFICIGLLLIGLLLIGYTFYSPFVEKQAGINPETITSQERFI
jgi:hypothetical protein